MLQDEVQSRTIHAPELSSSVTESVQQEGPLIKDTSFSPVIQEQQERELRTSEHQGHISKEGEALGLSEIGARIGESLPEGTLVAELRTGRVDDSGTSEPSIDGIGNHAGPTTIHATPTLPLSLDSGSAQPDPSPPAISGGGQDGGPSDILRPDGGNAGTALSKEDEGPLVSENFRSQEEVPVPNVGAIGAGSQGGEAVLPKEQGDEGGVIPESASATLPSTAEGVQNDDSGLSSAALHPSTSSIPTSNDLSTPATETEAMEDKKTSSEPQTSIPPTTSSAIPPLPPADHLETPPSMSSVPTAPSTHSKSKKPDKDHERSPSRADSPAPSSTGGAPSTSATGHATTATATTTATVATTTASAPPKKFQSTLSSSKRFSTPPAGAVSGSGVGAGGSSERSSIPLGSAGTTGAIASSGTSGSLAARPAPTATTSAPRLVTGKLTAGTTIGSGGGGGTPLASWARNAPSPANAPVATVFGKGRGSVDPTPSDAQKLAVAAAAAAAGRGSGRGRGDGFGSGAAGGPGGAWKRGSGPGGSGLGGLSGLAGDDFPTAAEAAKGRKGVGRTLATPKEKAAAAAARADAMNRHLLEGLDAFRGIHLDPNATHWDEIGDEEDDDFLGDEIKFGDGTSYKITDAPPDIGIASSEAQAEALANDPLLAPGAGPETVDGISVREEAFVDDFDRKSPTATTASGFGRKGAPVTARLEPRSLFNDRLGKFEPYSANRPPVKPSKDARGPGTVHVLQRTDGKQAPPHQFQHTVQVNHVELVDRPSRDRMGGLDPLKPVGPLSVAGPASGQNRPDRRAGDEKSPVAEKRTGQDGERQLPPHLARTSSRPNAVSEDVPPRRPAENKPAFDSAIPKPPTQLPPTKPDSLPPKPHAEPETANAVSPPVALSITELEKVQQQQMMSAAERARKRRQEEEDARQAERERARKKALELEEKIRASAPPQQAKHEAAPPAPSAPSAPAAPAAAPVSAATLGIKSSTFGTRSYPERIKQQRNEHPPAPPPAHPRKSSDQNVTPTPPSRPEPWRPKSTSGPTTKTEPPTTAVTLPSSTPPTQPRENVDRNSEARTRWDQTTMGRPAGHESLPARHQDRSSESRVSAPRPLAPSSINVPPMQAEQVRDPQAASGTTVDAATSRPSPFPLKPARSVEDDRVWRRTADNPPLEVKATPVAPGATKSGELPRAPATERYAPVPAGPKPTSSVKVLGGLPSVNLPRVRDTPVPTPPTNAKLPADDKHSVETKLVYAPRVKLGSRMITPPAPEASAPTPTPPSVPKLTIGAQAQNATTAKTGYKLPGISEFELTMSRIMGAMAAGKQEKDDRLTAAPGPPTPATSPSFPQPPRASPTGLPEVKPFAGLPPRTADLRVPNAPRGPRATVRPSATAYEPPSTFETTQLQRPATPPPAWKAYAARLPTMSRALPPVSLKVVQAFFKSGYPFGQRVRPFSWDAPPHFNDTLREDNLFRKRFHKGAMSSSVHLPKRRITRKLALLASSTHQATEMSGSQEHLGAGLNGRGRKGRSVEGLWRRPDPLEANEIHSIPTSLEVTSIPLVDLNPVEPSLETTSMDPLTPPPASPYVAIPAPSVRPSEANSIPMHLRGPSISLPSVSGSEASLANKSRTPKPKLPEGSNVAFYRASKVKTDVESVSEPPTSSRMFMVNSELNGLPVEDVSAPSQRKHEGNGKPTGRQEGLVAETAPKSSTVSATSSTSLRAPTTPPKTSTTSSASPWGQSPMALSVLDPQLKSVWSNPKEERPPKSLRMENSLEGLADDFPGAIPSLNDLRMDGSEPSGEDQKSSPPSHEHLSHPPQQEPGAGKPEMTNGIEGVSAPASMHYGSGTFAPDHSSSPLYSGGHFNANRVTSPGTAPYNPYPQHMYSVVPVTMPNGIPTTGPPQSWAPVSSAPPGFAPGSAYHHSGSHGSSGGYGHQHSPFAGAGLPYAGSAPYSSISLSPPYGNSMPLPTLGPGSGSGSSGYKHASHRNGSGPQGRNSVLPSSNEAYANGTDYSSYFNRYGSSHQQQQSSNGYVSTSPQIQSMGPIDTLPPHHGPSSSYGSSMPSMSPHMSFAPGPGDSSPGLHHPIHGSRQQQPQQKPYSPTSGPGMYHPLPMGMPSTTPGYGSGMGMNVGMGGGVGPNTGMGARAAVGVGAPGLQRYGGGGGPPGGGHHGSIGHGHNQGHGPGHGQAPGNDMRGRTTRWS